MRKLLKRSGTRGLLKAGLLALLSASNFAVAEPVFISTPRGGEGQGWLFGSPFDAQCWIAVPRHVIQLSPGGPLTEFQWRDRQGYVGLGMEPKSTGEVRSNSQAGDSGDPLDLAFSRVSARPSGECLSRLGFNDLTSLIATRPMVVAAMRMATLDSPQRMRVSDFDHATLTLTAEDAAAQQSIDEGRGISGSPVLFQDPAGNTVPIGLVIKTDPEGGIALALRFDRVKRAFTEFQTELANSTSPSQSTNASPFTIDRVLGESTAAVHGLEGLADPERCWGVAPNQGLRRIEIDFSLAPDSKATTLKLRFDDRCGQLPDSLQVHRPLGAQWMSLSDCTMGDSIATCRLDGRTSNKLKLVIVSRKAATIGIQRLQFE